MSDSISSPTPSSEAFLDSLLSIPRLSGARVSPDGAWCAWTWYGLAPTGDIYLARTDGSTPPQRLTQTGENTAVVSWTSDSRSLIVSHDRSGDERVQLFEIHLDSPGDLQPLTDASPSYYLHGGELHPNGRWLFYSMNYDTETGREIEASWIYRHDLETGERRPLACPKRPGYHAPQLNHEGSTILYSRQDLDPAGNQIWLVDIEGKDDREILNFGPTVKVEASWLPDDSQVLFVAEAGTHRRVGVWDVQTGATRILLDDPTRNIEYAFAPRGSDRSVVVVLEVGAARVLPSLLDMATGEETSIAPPTGNLVPYRPLSNGEWIGEYYSSTGPSDIVRFHTDNVASENFHSVTGLWNHISLQREELTPAEEYRWRSIDGLEIRGWLYRPRGTSKGLIVRVHGGPTAHSEDSFHPADQFFTSQGFTVLTPNYRGSTGFGLAFQEAIKEDGWGGREQDDIAAGIEALIADGTAQPGKVGVTGTSYGGYSSWCAITRYPPSLVAAAAPICGMTDLVVDYETTRPDLRPYSADMMGGTPDERPELYRERSPIHFVDRIQGNLLIIQGARDPNVTPENVRVVREALDRAGVAYDVLIFEDEGHGISKRENQRILYRRLVQFFTVPAPVAVRS